MVGRRFARLTVVTQAPSLGGRRRGTRWRCRCRCGNTVVVSRSSLVTKHTRSCGCLHVDSARKIRTVHGESRPSTPEYRAWHAMRARCLTPSHAGYKDYGGRGISICRRWQRSYKAFLRDVGRRPSDRHTIGRIDNDGPYSPRNVEWQTCAQQLRNTRRSRKLTISGRTLNLKDWAKESGVHYVTISYRLRVGWPLHDAVFSSPNPGQRRRRVAHA